jgi:hypothetical protein
MGFNLKRLRSLDRAMEQKGWQRARPYIGTYYTCVEGVNSTVWRKGWDHSMKHWTIRVAPPGHKPTTTNQPTLRSCLAILQAYVVAEKLRGGV